MTEEALFNTAHERICRQFEQSWMDGRPRRIDDFLPEADHPDFNLLLIELALSEMELGLKQHGVDDESQRFTVESYVARYPQLSGDDARQRLIEQEWRLRQQLEIFDSASFAQRFPAFAAPTTRGGNRETERQVGPFVSGDRVGQYVLVEQAGRGGFAVVWKAWDEQLRRDVAIKMPHANTLLEVDARERFLREARAVAALRHPGIVPILEVGEEADIPYIVLEFVDGTTLAGTSSDTTSLVRNIRDIALALDAAHECGIVHRDVKPSNILVDQSGRARVTDFGIAQDERSTMRLTCDGDFFGTPAYMAPEQASGRSGECDGRTDVYSLGVALYEGLTGQLPFSGRGPAIVQQILNATPPRPRQLNPEIPRDLETICLKAMEREPLHRYQTAALLAEDLRRFLEHEPVLARPVGRLQRLLRAGRRHPVSTLLVVTLLAFSVLTAVLLWRLGDNARRSAEPETASTPAGNGPGTNSLGMQLVRIEAGEFTMGRSAPFGDGSLIAIGLIQPLPIEQPAHQVTITRPFLMSAHEVTVGQFRAFVNTARHQPESGYGYVSATGFSEFDADFTWENPGWRQTENHPVMNVSWEDAVAFCRWLSNEEGHTYRLPTEAEWEYACRAGTSSVYSSGDALDSLQDYANVADASFRRIAEDFADPGYWDFTVPWNDGFPFTAPVGQFRPNPWGLYDMHGNVQEWVSDWYGLYPGDAQRTDPVGPVRGTHRVKRGGDWNDYASICRTTFRRSELEPHERRHYIGFRVVREIDP